MDADDPGRPTGPQRVVAVAGLVAIVLIAPIAIGLFGAPALGWVLVFGGLVAVMVSIGLATRAIISRRFPAVSFHLSDTSGPAAELDDVAARLAPGDYAAFAIYAGNEDREATGQIWLYAASAGGIERTAIELEYDAAAPPRRHEALGPLLDAGFEITGWEPGHWVLLGRAGGVDSAEAIRLVAAAAGALGGMDGVETWTFRAIA